MGGTSALRGARRGGRLRTRSTERAAGGRPPSPRAPEAGPPRELGVPVRSPRAPLSWRGDGAPAPHLQAGSAHPPARARRPRLPRLPRRVRGTSGRLGARLQDRARGGPGPGCGEARRGHGEGSSVPRPRVCADSLAPHKPRPRVATWRPEAEASAGVGGFAHLGSPPPRRGPGRGTEVFRSEQGESLLPRRAKVSE